MRESIWMVTLVFGSSCLICYNCAKINTHKKWYYESIKISPHAPFRDSETVKGMRRLIVWSDLFIRNPERTSRQWCRGILKVWQCMTVAVCRKCFWSCRSKHKSGMSFFSSFFLFLLERRVWMYGWTYWNEKRHLLAMRKRNRWWERKGKEIVEKWRILLRVRLRSRVFNPSFYQGFVCVWVWIWVEVPCVNNNFC